MFHSLRVFVSIFFSSEIFQSVIQKLCCTIGTARLLTGSILFLLLSSILEINLTLLFYSFLIFSSSSSYYYYYYYYRQKTLYLGQPSKKYYTDLLPEMQR